MKDTLEPIMNRTMSFLEEDMGIAVISKAIEILSPKKVELKKNTVMIGTGGSIQVILTIGYDDLLLDKLVEAFLEGEKIDDDEKDEIRESVSCEFLNTVVGNAMTNFAGDGVISITPPVLIYEAKSLFKYKDSKIVTATIKTDFGDMTLAAVGPRELFEKELEFKEL